MIKLSTQLKSRLSVTDEKRIFEQNDDVFTIKRVGI